MVLGEKIAERRGMEVHSYNSSTLSSGDNNLPLVGGQLGLYGKLQGIKGYS